MSDSDDYDERLYCDREEWADVTPVEQEDCEDPVVPIRYSVKFNDCHSYLRAVMKSGEKSKRALELTKTVIDCNAANYTAWKYRRDIIIATGSSIEAELRIIADMLAGCPKNFQIWHHRRELLIALGSPSNEKEITYASLISDAKNYHAWSHRRWLVTHFDLLDGEEEFVLGLIEDDFRNNSAWNYLFYVIETKHLGINPELHACTKSEAEHIRIRGVQIATALKYLELSPSNETVHNYIVGNLIPRKGGHTRAVFAAHAATVEAALLRHNNPAAVFPKATLAEIYKFAGSERAFDTSTLPGLNCSPLERANALYAELVTADPIRKKYWSSLVVDMD